MRLATAEVRRFLKGEILMAFAARVSSARANPNVQSVIHPRLAARGHIVTKSQNLVLFKFDEAAVRALL